MYSKDNAENFNDIVQYVERQLRPHMLKYLGAIKEIEAIMDVLKEDFRMKYSYNPIEHVKSRLKTPASIVKKAMKNNLSLDIETILEEIKDIAGVRIICTFTDDIYRIVEIFKSNPEIKILTIKDYVTNPKPSGYASYHLIIQVPVFLTSGREYVTIELQIRTMAMDFWSCLEHKIKYKFEGDIPEEVKEDLRKSAKAVIDLDQKMLDLHKIVNSDE